MLIASLMTLNAMVRNGQSAKGALEENIHAGLSNLGDQIVNGGNHVANQIIRGDK